METQRVTVRGEAIIRGLLTDLLGSERSRTSCARPPTQRVQLFSASASSAGRNCPPGLCGFQGSGGLQSILKPRTTGQKSPYSPRRHHHRPAPPDYPHTCHPGFRAELADCQHFAQPLEVPWTRSGTGFLQQPYPLATVEGAAAHHLPMNCGQP